VRVGGANLVGASISEDYSERRAEGQRNASPHLINRFTLLLDQLSLDASHRERIDGALELMLALHAYQEPRPDGEPYVNHPLRVAIAAIEKFGIRDPFAICAAFLHDTVEDQAVTLVGILGGALAVEGNLQTKALDALEGRFGKKVRSLVGLLTNPDFDAEAARLKEAGDARSASDIKNVLYKEHFFEIYEADVEAFAIKMADFSENALAIDNLLEGQKKQKLKAKYGPVLREALQKLQSPAAKLIVPDSTLAEMKRVLRLSYAG
jgi:(p)ppGpp synthase/HD superfamily hydrolase